MVQINFEIDLIRMVEDYMQGHPVYHGIRYRNDSAMVKDLVRDTIKFDRLRNGLETMQTITSQ